MNLKIDRTRNILAKERARMGMARRFCWRNAFRQDGALGWSNAHDSIVVAGWAGDVIGDIDLTDKGSVHGFAGCRIGDVNALVRNISISMYTFGVEELDTYGHLS